MYNQRLHESNPKQLLLFDRKLEPIPNIPGPGVEICDIFDVKNKKLIHIKRSGRKSAIISHFLNQGLTSAKVLRTYPQVKSNFFDKLKKHVSPQVYAELEDTFPHNWTIEFAFGDGPIKGSKDYTIPFFSRVSFDEVKREIEALGYKPVKVSFIKLSKP